MSSMGSNAAEVLPARDRQLPSVLFISERNFSYSLITLSTPVLGGAEVGMGGGGAAVGSGGCSGGSGG